MYKHIANCHGLVGCAEVLAWVWLCLDVWFGRKILSN